MTDISKQIEELVGDIASLGTDHPNDPPAPQNSDEAKQAILALIATQKAELLDSLYWMYVQYCSGGHDFMGAGETASELLENAGYIETDGAGRITKDYGDSEEQRLNKLKEEQR